MRDWRADIRRRVQPLHLHADREAEIVEELARDAEDRYRAMVSGGLSAAEVTERLATEIDRGAFVDALRAVTRSAPAAVPPAGMHAPFWRGLRTDLRLTLRRLGQAPGYAIVCVLTLAFGIGGNTAVFTLIDRAMLEPLPVTRPHELYRVGSTGACCVNGGLPNGPFSLFSRDLYEHLRNAAPQFSALAAFQADVGTLAIGYAEAGVPPLTMHSSFVSGNYFGMFDLSPAAGRLLTLADDRPGAAPVAVISHRAWMLTYQRRPEIVGTPIRLNGIAATIVGVAPEGFYGEMLGRREAGRRKLSPDSHSG